MQKKITNNADKDNLFESRMPDNQWKMSYLLKNLDESLLLDSNFEEKLLDLVIEKGYKITRLSPNYLKQNEKLAENYYKDLLENNIENLLIENIINSKLLKNRDFLDKYINLLKQKSINDENIINSLIHNEECVNVIKNDLELFQFIFETIMPENLEKFFYKFFTKKEIDLILTHNQELQGGLLRVSQIYNKDKTILQSLNGKLLTDKYANIPTYKMQLIAKNEQFQDEILQLNGYEYSLYSKMAQLVAEKTDRWNRFEKNIVENLSDGYYDELINDLYEQAKQGNKITSKELETLCFLFSKGSLPIKTSL